VLSVSAANATRDGVSFMVVVVGGGVGCC
jgi:hypothetical protein